MTPVPPEIIRKTAFFSWWLQGNGCWLICLDSLTKPVFFWWLQGNRCWLICLDSLTKPMFFFWLLQGNGCWLICLDSLTKPMFFFWWLQGNGCWLICLDSLNCWKQNLVKTPWCFCITQIFVNWFKLDCSTCRATCIQPI